jgi:acetolactate synthase I/III small subunit
MPAQSKWGRFGRGRSPLPGDLMSNGNGSSEPRKHIVSVLVENRFGVLSRVAGLFSARGYNIESLSVGETLDPAVSRMTLVVRGDEFVIEQVTKQLHKLIDVIKVNDLTDDHHVERELVLIRVNAEPQHRAEILRTADIFRAKVIDVTSVSFILEATGDEMKIEALIELLRPMGIQEIVRTGKVAIARGPKTRVRRVESAKRARPSEDPRIVGFAD